MRGGASRDDRDRMEAQEAERAGGAASRVPPPTRAPIPGAHVTPTGGGAAAAAAVTPRRGHARSASHGGTAWSSISSDVPYYLYQHQAPPAPSARHEGHYTQAAGVSDPEYKITLASPMGVGVTARDPFPPNSSVLMNPGAAAPTDYTDHLYHTAGSDNDRTHHRSHQRTFSHGQTVDGVTGTHHRGHRRAGSRTDFILPDGHEQREKERVRAKPPVGRTSSFPLGHKRTTSKTESIYTIRENKVPLLQRLMFWKKGPEEQTTRTVVANHVLPPHVASPNAAYPTNKITTTKYTLLTFLPKNIFEQFHRFANIYFLFIVLLNFVPAINAFAKEVAMVPLLFVLGVTAVKDLFEDRRRYNSDKKVNNSTCRVYCRNKETATPLLLLNLSLVLWQLPLLCLSNVAFRAASPTTSAQIPISPLKLCQREKHPVNVPLKYRRDEKVFENWSSSDSISSFSEFKSSFTGKYNSSVWTALSNPNNIV